MIFINDKQSLDKAIEHKLNISSKTKEDILNDFYSTTELLHNLMERIGDVEDIAEEVKKLEKEEDEFIQSFINGVFGKGGKKQ